MSGQALIIMIVIIPEKYGTVFIIMTTIIMITITSLILSMITKIVTLIKEIVITFIYFL